MHIKRENETEKDRERSVFSTVFLALVAVLAVEIAMLLLSFTLSGFTSRLNSNAERSWTSRSSTAPPISPAS